MNARQHVIRCFKNEPCYLLEAAHFCHYYERILVMIVQRLCWCPALHQTLLGLFTACLYGIHRGKRLGAVVNNC